MENNKRKSPNFPKQNKIDFWKIRDVIDGNVSYEKGKIISKEPVLSIYDCKFLDVLSRYLNFNRWNPVSISNPDFIKAIGYGTRQFFRVRKSLIENNYITLINGDNTKLPIYDLGSKFDLCKKGDDSIETKKDAKNNSEEIKIYAVGLGNIGSGVYEGQTRRLKHCA